VTTPTEYLNLMAAVATPTAEDRSNASKHRAAIEDALTDQLGILRMFETGSWSHGTAVATWSDVDYFASMPGARSLTSAGDLERVRAALGRGLPGATVYVSRPVVKVSYPGGPYVEVAPAHYAGDDDYFIPDPAGTGWIKSSPLKHNEYVNESARRVSGTKRFIRLVKDWKYTNGAPISSLYLELRAAKHVRDNLPFIEIWDLAWFFRDLMRNGLADMNDPSRFDGRRIAATTNSQRPSATKFVEIAARAAELALNAYRNNQDAMAVDALKILFER
jgi:hypothetical protein